MISDLKDSDLPNHTPYLNISHISVVTFGISSISKNLGSKRNISTTVQWRENPSFSPDSRDLRNDFRLAQIFRQNLVDFDIGIELCREYGLPELEKRLYSLKHTSERPVLEAEPSHVEPRLPQSDTVSAWNESTQSRSIWNRDQPLTLPGGSISDGPIEAEDADEMDPGSDVVGSEDSVTSREPCPIQRNPQPVPSIRCAKDATSLRQSGRDIKRSLLELADPHSPSAKSVPYEVWDSRPQLSKLIEVKPELRLSSWKTASHYGSLSDLFAPG